MSTRSRVVVGAAAVVVALSAVGIVLAHSKRSGHPDTVIVPGIRNGGVLFAFDQLRGSGLRVAIPATIPFGATSSPFVADQTPRGGTRVKWGSVVSLRLNGGFIGSPGGPQKLPVYRVPDFSGKRLAEAVDWTEGKFVYWESTLPPLPPSSAKHLFDAYVIKSQNPRPGSDVKLWKPVPGRGIRLTPLVLEAEPR